MNRFLLAQRHQQLFSIHLQRRMASSSASNNLVARATALAEPVIYGGRVAVEFGKQVAAHAKITLPTLAQLTEAQLGFANFFAAFQNGAWKKVTLSQAGALVSAGITVYGFFLFGEMVGRWNINGYKIEGAGGHGHH